MEDKLIDRTRLRTAARQANLEEFIEKLPLKYQTMVGAEGVGLSETGTAYLYRRCAHKDPSFVFLDEATSPLDANNERIITGNLLDFCKGRTVLIVAHRLSTIRHADRIVVLHKGRIVEEDTHDELCARHGYYYELINNQLIAMG